jgi:cellulose synthase/poly-beta-1,6-N-acetylglucosamine synthase-like glycosyltransferase
MAFVIVLILIALAHLVLMMALSLSLLLMNERPEVKGHPVYRLHESKQLKQNALPSVSVVIPVRNEGANIISCLESILAQDYPPGLIEIIVSDDQSEDYTVEKVQRWSLAHPECRLQVLQASGRAESERGKKNAVERAVRHSSSEIIISTDADTLREPSWVQDIVKPFGQAEVRMVLGPVCFTGEKGMFQKIQSLEFLGIMGVTAASAGLGHPLMCNGANLAYRKDAFMECGGFAGNKRFASGDDQFLMMEFRKKYGGRAVCFRRTLNARVVTYPCSDWNEFWEQRLRWASKSRGYRDPWMIAAGAIMAGNSALILAGGILGAFYPGILMFSAFIWFVRILAEYPLVHNMAGYFGKKQYLSFYFVAQVFQFFYSLAVLAASPFRGFAWKGRFHRL